MPEDNRHGWHTNCTRLLLEGGDRPKKQQVLSENVLQFYLHAEEMQGSPQMLHLHLRVMEVTLIWKPANFSVEMMLYGKVSQNLSFSTMKTKQCKQFHGGILILC